MPGLALMVVGLMVACTTAAPAASILMQDQPLSLKWLATPDATKTLLRSGFDYHDANYDSGNLIRVEPAGMSFSNVNSRWVLFEAAGPGVITSLWFTGKNKQGQAYIGGRLKFYFDGETNASLTGLLPEWLERNPFLPAGLAEKSSGGWLNYAPVYYAKSLKITLEEHGDSFTHRKNGRDEIIPHIYHQFSYQKLPASVKSSSVESLRQTRSWAEDRLPRMEPPSIHHLPAGGRLEVAGANGQGILELLRLDFGAVTTNADAVRLRIESDGVARVNLTVKEFWGFSRAQRPQTRFQALTMGQDDAGAYYTRWPMPHHQGLKVILENPGEAMEIKVQSLHRQGWPTPEQFYFHAARIADRTEAGRDINLLSATGRGHYVGCILELANKTLEGDDRFYVDGEAFPPAWHGTGTEDYFRCGWYFFGGPLTRPLYGLLDGGTPKLAYRFHLADRINYTRSVRIGFEHGHKNDYLGPYLGTVFWYAER